MHPIVLAALIIAALILTGMIVAALMVNSETGKDQEIPDRQGR